MRECSIDGCNIIHKAQGYCSKHYQRIKKNGFNKSSNFDYSIIQRFYLKTKRNHETGCLDWTGSCLPKGYGNCTIKGKWVRSHRAIYELINGPIPNGLHCLHKCDNPRCCEISHLFLGTNKDNVIDKMKKNRCSRPLGSANHFAKINENLVVLIKKQLEKGVLNSSICNEFGVSKYVVSQIKTGRTWSHIKI